MTVRVDRHGRVRATTGATRPGILSRTGIDVVEASFPTRSGSPAEEYEKDRVAHLQNRPCVIDGCDDLIPCPDHGTPVEDCGEWLFGGRR